MSVKTLYFAFTQAVFAANLKPHDKLVLLAYADHYNWTKGTPAYPSFTTVAKKTGLSHSTIKRVVAKLIELGWLEQVGDKIIDNGYVNKFKVQIGKDLSHRSNIELHGSNIEAHRSNLDLTGVNYKDHLTHKQINITNKNLTKKDQRRNYDFWTRLRLAKKQVVRINK